MFVTNNPVLQRELLVNLRTGRAFLLLAAYVGLLALVTYVAWPNDRKLDLASNDVDARKSRELIDVFFLGQFILSSLMTPTFAAGSITGEKEKKTYEMLLASPLRPMGIVLGKFLASLTHLALLIVASLPIVMLCIPLGGASVVEVAAAYLGLVLSVLLFGMISLWCSSYFSRTAAALLVSYLLILPLALVFVLVWQALSADGSVRLAFVLVVLPVGVLITAGGLALATARRLLHPPDVGSEGKEVVDLETESRHVVGMVIQSDQYPDKLFAPAKRTDFIEDGMNPVFDKEMRSELFSQGTLMLRLVIQVSMLLAIPIMAFCLYIYPYYAPWYIAYVLLFNMLAGPVFSADRVTGERERETLELLLTTLITPWQILWGKLVSGLRVSTVLTLFLVWPLVLACVLTWDFWMNLPTVGLYLVVILVTCATTANLALFCSVQFRKTAHSLITSYLLILVLFVAPLAARYFAGRFFPGTTAEFLVNLSQVTSPIAAVFALPLTLMEGTADVTNMAREANWPIVFGYLIFATTFNLVSLALMTWLFQTRWRIVYA